MTAAPKQFQLAGEFQHNWHQIRPWDQHQSCPEYWAPIATETKFENWIFREKQHLNAGSLWPFTDLSKFKSHHLLFLGWKKRSGLVKSSRKYHQCFVPTLCKNVNFSLNALNRYDTAQPVYLHLVRWLRLSVWLLLRHTLINMGFSYLPPENLPFCTLHNLHNQSLECQTLCPAVTPGEHCM